MHKSISLTKVVQRYFMAIDYKVKTRSGISRFFTVIYWRFRLAALWGGKPELNIIEVFEFELPEGAVKT